MKTKYRVILIALFLVGFLPFKTTPENYNSWLYYRNVNLNTKNSGAKVTTNQLNFPVLLRLKDGTNFTFSQADSSGKDIRFSKINGNHLYYQLERWCKSCSPKVAEIWVKVDTVYGSDSLHPFRMYWGKAGAPDSSKPSTVFSNSNGFSNVFHLAEDTGIFSDATGMDTAYRATANVKTVPAIIGNGFFTDSSSFRSGVRAQPMPTLYNFTFSAWTSIKTAKAGEDVFGNYDWVNKGVDQEFTTPTNALQNFFGNGTNTGYGWHASYYSLNTWFYHTATYDTSNGVLSTFYNGVYKFADTLASGGKGKLPFTYTYTEFANNHADDTTDEIRLDNIKRPADWIKLNYESQQLKDSLVSYGSTTAGTMKVSTLVPYYVRRTKTSNITGKYLVTGYYAKVNSLWDSLYCSTDSTCILLTRAGNPYGKDTLKLYNGSNHVDTFIYIKSGGVFW